MHAVALREFGGSEAVDPIEVDPPRPGPGAVVEVGPGVTTPRTGDHATAAPREALPEAVEPVHLGRITPRIQTFPVTEAARAHRLMAERRVTGRAVLVRG